MIFGSKCPSLYNTRIVLLTKGICKHEPASPELCNPITPSCLTTLHNGFISQHTDIISAMFLLAFLFSSTSNFNPALDLQKLHSDTIWFLIKQSKTDQFRKCHTIFIFSLASDLQPFQYLSHNVHLISMYFRLM